MGRQGAFSHLEDLGYVRANRSGQRVYSPSRSRACPCIKRDFWQDDPHNGDVIQHLYFCIEGEPDAYRLAFMRSTLDDCAHPHNTNERHRVEEYIRQKVSTFFARKSSPLT